MGWMNQVGNLLERYAGGGAAPAPENVNADFARVAQSAPQQNLGQGLGAAFRSDQTPPFGQMVANLFSQSNNEQKAGLLNHFGQQMTPEQASAVSPDAVQQMAEQAKTQDPSIMDTVGHFYAQHPTLVQGLGAAALAMVMSHMSQR